MSTGTTKPRRPTGFKVGGGITKKTTRPRSKAKDKVSKPAAKSGMNAGGVIPVASQLGLSGDVPAPPPNFTFNLNVTTQATSAQGPVFTGGGPFLPPPGAPPGYFNSTDGQPFEPDNTARQHPPNQFATSTSYQFPLYDFGHFGSAGDHTHQANQLPLFTPDEYSAIFSNPLAAPIFNPETGYRWGADTTDVLPPSLGPQPGTSDPEPEYEQQYEPEYRQQYEQQDEQQYEEQYEEQYIDTADDFDPNLPEHGNLVDSFHRNMLPQFTVVYNQAMDPDLSSGISTSSFLQRSYGMPPPPTDASGNVTGDNRVIRAISSTGLPNDNRRQTRVPNPPAPPRLAVVNYTDEDMKMLKKSGKTLIVSEMHKICAMPATMEKVIAKVYVAAEKELFPEAVARYSQYPATQPTEAPTWFYRATFNAASNMRTGFKSTANGMLLDAFATRLPTTTFQSRRIHRQAIFQSLVSQNPTAATGAPEIPFLHLPANPSNMPLHEMFGLPQLEWLIQSAVYKGATSYGTLEYPIRVPASAVALACAALKCSLDCYLTGRHVEHNFSIASYGDFYMTVLNYINDETDHSPDQLRNFQHLCDGIAARSS